MPISVLVEDVEAFARLNYLRDLVEDDEMPPWHSCKDLYLEEAKCKQVREGYVLTNLELIDIIGRVNG